MRERLQRIKDTAFAHGMELGSSLADSHPGLLARFVGDNPVPWHIAKTPDDTRESWKYFEPNERSGFWAKSYRTGVVLSVGRRALLAEALEHRGVPASAFAMGHMVMAAELGDEAIEGKSDEVLVTMRKGKTGPLVTTLGTFRASGKMFIPLQTEELRVVADDVPAEQLASLYQEAIHR